MPCLFANVSRLLDDGNRRHSLAVFLLRSNSVMRRMNERMMDGNKTLDELGWGLTNRGETVLPEQDDRVIARVIAQYSDVYQVVSEEGEFAAKVTGKFRYGTKALKDYPVVGDFVLAERIELAEHGRIHQIVPRKNGFSRKMPISGGRKLHKGVLEGGITEEQVVAANIDTVFILCGLDGNFNVARLERYLTLVQASKLEAVIVLSKIDVCGDAEPYLKQAQEVARGAGVLPISAANGIGLDAFGEYMQEGRTLVFLGSSGVGKSTLLNALLERDVQATKTTSLHSGKGKHTTTHRQMFFHPSGCMIIDTPGMKELQLWAEDDDLDSVYGDIVDLIAQCKFFDCTHKNERGCAIQAAMASGALARERYSRYVAQSKEIKRLGERKKVLLQKQEKFSRR